jgi:hypothetical protein
MKNMKIFYILSAAVLTLTLSLAGCDTFFEPPAAKPKDGKALVQIKFGLAKGRTVMPDNGDLKFPNFKLTLTPAIGSPIEKNNEDFDAQGRMELNEGTWDIVAEIFLESTYETKIGGGKVEGFIVTDIGPNIITIDLTFPGSDLEGTGEFEYEITCVGLGAADSAEMQLIFLSDNVNPPPADRDIPLTPTSMNSISPIELDAGYYSVKVTIKKGFIETGSWAMESVYTDVVHIYPDIPTKLVKDFKSTDFYSTLDDLWIAYSEDTAVATSWIYDSDTYDEDKGSFTFEFTVTDEAWFAFRLTDPLPPPTADAAWFAPAADEFEPTVNDANNPNPMTFNNRMTGTPNLWYVDKAGDYKIHVSYDGENGEWEFTVNFTSSTLADVTNTALHNFITLTPPANGDDPDDAISTTSTQYSVSNLKWTDNADNDQVTAFVGGNYYKAVFTLSPLGNYTFSGLTPLATAFTYTGATVTAEADGDDATVTVTFLATKSAVTNTVLSTYITMTAPDDGDDPVDTISTTSSQYTVSNLKWTDNADADQTTAFVGGQTYKAVFTLSPAAGYTFSGLTPLATAFTYTGATVTAAADGDDVTVTVTFLATGGTTFEPVTSIDDVPTTVRVGMEVDLTAATAFPGNATNKVIVWSLSPDDDGSTGITNDEVESGTFTPTLVGTITVRATIANGKAEDEDYVEDFEITVNAAITYTVSANNPTGPADSTLLTFVFNEPITGLGLTQANIAITTGYNTVATITPGSWNPAAPPNDETTFTLGITALQTENIRVTITRPGIVGAESTNIPVFKAPTTINPTVKVTFNLPGDETINFDQGSVKTSASVLLPLEITVTSAHNTITWFIDGNLSSETSKTLMLTLSDLGSSPYGKHQVTATGIGEDGKPYSKNLTFDLVP